MGSTFGGINTALTSLYAQRRGLDVTGQNIANANTEGYSRQRVTMRSLNSNTVPGMYSMSAEAGAGVAVSSVDRLRSAGLDQRSYIEHGTSAYHTERAGSYGLIEEVFAEPSDTALQARLQDLWDGWNAVAMNPTQSAPKAALLEQATTAAASLNDAATSLNNQYTTNRTGLDIRTAEVNKTAAEIAKLNKEIVVATGAGLQPNELADQRGQLMLKLSDMIGATAQTLPNGSMNVYVGNAALVSEFTSQTIEVAPGSATRLEDLATTGVNLRWADTGLPVNAGGTMGAQMELLGKGGTLDEIAGRLDKVAAALAKTVNDLHSTGYSIDGTTGQNLFIAGGGVPAGTPITAANIAVGITDTRKLAVSGGDPTGTPPVLDGSIADSLSDLGASTSGADAEYQSMIGDLGVVAQSSMRRRDIQVSVTEQVDAARDAESGVNLDEEMTNLLTYQRGYEAASRVLTTIDSMLDQLINRTGLVGR
ncbi:flagellar hook-associated protein FlgK [Actinoplanes hulinensis]|uniref:Flagellar hook-associated protein 1 n=1 Tax=Actinoplanes hulinensis TaxID=1144547 RepID=A0ABS7AW34_9ACTN|nr:flagellar hook-associated protein FlgK [Actinoplanes hulinensis]MBW6432985.1 flagellar hook-associated protein FlgK [Actinoplanes hulinensis]